MTNTPKRPEMKKNRMGQDMVAPRHCEKAHDYILHLEKILHHVRIYRLLRVADELRALEIEHLADAVDDLISGMTPPSRGE